MRFHPLAAAAALSCALIGASVAHEVDEGKGQLGKVRFDNSCEAKVQKELQPVLPKGGAGSKSD